MSPHPTPRRVTAAELYARRLALGLSQDDLARALGVTQATLSRWENGARAVGANVDAELAVLEDALEDAVHDRLTTSRHDAFTDAAGERLPPDEAVATARAHVWHRRATTTGLTRAEWASLATVARTRAEETSRHRGDFDGIPAPRWEAIAEALDRLAR